ncbi:hypothetical protein COU79_04875, partial [Candidatus Peregrinibacteria bacterium CG10_big_fil_rev_8_21_14_0_10_54_7]
MQIHASQSTLLSSLLGRGLYQSDALRASAPPEEEILLSFAPGTECIIINDLPEAVISCSLGNNARLQWFDTAHGREQIKSTLSISLDGEGAHVQLNGMFLGKEDEHMEIKHMVHHRAPHTSSELLTRGVLTDSARADYAATIIIHKNMHGCSGQQSAHTLLLSEGAHVDAVPALEIENDDVAASHSVSTSYVDALKLFYMQSRGIQESDAVQIIVAGHFGEVLARLQNTPFEHTYRAAFS